MRARLALRYAGVRVELREVVLRDKPAEMLAASPKATVPVLCLTDGKVLEESLDIMRWALAQSDPDGWLVQGTAGEGEALITRNDDPFKHLLDRYKYANRHPEKSMQAWRDEAVELHIAPLEQRLLAARHLLGEKVALADMALLPFVRQFALVDPDWFDGGDTPAFPALHDWLARLTGTALFAKVMQKQLPWKQGAEAVFF
ncbi:MAG: hypothetical protein JWL63_2110 [Rhodocyclales bacterium]|nr:hypothetical protein [Rhodocyclales bacterium]